MRLKLSNITFHLKNSVIHVSILVFNQNCELVSQLPNKLSGDKKKPYLIDEPAAAIVREIFELKKNGESIHSIMRAMDEKYPTPRQYLYERGLVKKMKDNPHWDMSEITRILTNRVYLGHMVRGMSISIM